MINFFNLALSNNHPYSANFSSFFDLMPKLMVIFFIGFFILFIVVIIFNIFVLKKEFKKNQSARTTFVPFLSDRFKEDFPTPEKSNDNKCIYCGKEITPGSEYCSHCGKKQVKTYTKIFNRKNMSNEEFINMINTRLASNDRVANVECEMMTNTGYGLVVNKYFLDSVALKFEVFENPNKNQYALTSVSKFGFKHTSTTDIINEWKLHNPTAKIIKTVGGTTMRGDQGAELFNGIGASNNAQLFVFFKVPRK